MEFFKARVQYHDWDGTAAADNADVQLKSVYKALEDQGKLKSTDYLLAVDFWVGENTTRGMGLVSVTAYIYEGAQSFEDFKAALAQLGDEPVPVRQEELELTIEQFVLLFKRFDVMLIKSGLPIEDREFHVINR